MRKGNCEVVATESRMSKLFGFSERKIRNYFKDARIAPARYDLLLAIKIFVENADGKDEVSEARRVDTETKKLKLEIMRENYHHVDDVELLVTDMLMRFKGKITAIPSKASIKLLNITSRREVEEILKKELNEALLELSSYDELRMEDVDGTEDN